MRSASYFFIKKSTFFKFPCSHPKNVVPLHQNGIIIVQTQVTILVTIKYLKYMKKYICDVCGWEYDPAVGVEESGVAPGTAWEDLPADFVCPLCGVGKDEFSVSE